MSKQQIRIKGGGGGAQALVFVPLGKALAKSAADLWLRALGSGAEGVGEAGGSVGWEGQGGWP